MLIIGASIVAAVAYGIVHDQVTARICVEYFTVGHPPVFGTNSPTLLGLGWGVIATWWVGLILGIMLAAAARAGQRPKRSPRSLARPILTLLGVMAACAAPCGWVGYRLATNHIVGLPARLAERIPPDRHAAFLADLFAHNASYGVGFLGGIVLCVMIWRSRGRASPAA
jgi:hypothetical protein